MLDPKELINDATEILHTYPLGMLATVDDEGTPHVRWMTIAAPEGVRRLFTLTGNASRKVDQIRRHPDVCWIFSTPRHDDVLTLYGKAELMRSPVVVQEVWDELSEATRSYAMGPLSDEHTLELVAIQTIVSRIEFYSPRRKMFHPQTLDLPPRS